MTEGTPNRTAEEIRQNPEGSTLFDYVDAKRTADAAVSTNGHGAEPVAEAQPAMTSPTESIVRPQTENEAALQVIGKTPKDRQRRFAGVLLNKNDTFDGGSELWSALLQAAESSPYMHELQQAFQSEDANEIKTQLDTLLTRILINESSSKLGQFAKDMAADDRPKLVAAILYEYFNPEFVVPPKQTFLKRFGVAIKTRVTQPLANFLRRLGVIDLQGLSPKVDYPNIADEIAAQQLRKQSVAVPPAQENQRSTFLSKEQQKRYADRLRSISASVAAEMGLTLNKFNFDGNLANALSGSTQNEVIDSLGNDVLEGFFTPDAEGEFTQEQSAFIGEVINRLFDESHIADNEVVENAEMLSNRVFRLEQTLEKAITDSDAPARMKIEPELAQARAEFRALQSRSDAKKDDDKAETSSKKPFWQRFFPSKAPKPLEPMMQQVADSGPVVSEEEKERIIVSLRDEKESREREAELQRVDTEYVLNLVSTAIETGSAAENKHVQAVAEFMLRLAIETKNQLNLAPKQEAELRKHLERAQLHPNERHAAERPFESELKTAASEAIEKSSQTPGQKSWLRKALETAGIVVSGALASTALGAMGAGPESRMAVSSVVLLATAAVGDTTPGTFVRGTLVGLGENQNLPSWIRGIAQGASGAAHRVQDRTRTLFAFFGGMLGEATIELGARLLQEAAPAAQVAAPVVESASNPLTKASEAAVQNLLQQFAEARPLVESAPDQAASEVAKTIAGAARTFTDRLAQDPGQIDVVLQQAQTYFTPERVHAIAEVVSKFDPAVGPQMLTAPETAQLATNSQEAVQSITALMDQVSGMTTDQRAQQLTPWVNQITSVLKNFQAIAPAR